MNPAAYFRWARLLLLLACAAWRLLFVALVVLKLGFRHATFVRVEVLLACVNEECLVVCSFSLLFVVFVVAPPLPRMKPTLSRSAKSARHRFNYPLLIHPSVHQHHDVCQTVQDHDGPVPGKCRVHVRVTLLVCLSLRVRVFACVKLVLTLPSVRGRAVRLLFFLLILVAQLIGLSWLAGGVGILSALVVPRVQNQFSPNEQSTKAPVTTGVVTCVCCV